MQGVVFQSSEDHDSSPTRLQGQSGGELRATAARYRFMHFVHIDLRHGLYLKFLALKLVMLFSNLDCQVLKGGLQ